jgi:metal-sulfur cluster biosynthetic enzyme
MVYYCLGLKEITGLGPVPWPAGRENMNEQVLNALKQVIDPELGVNVVDLGLIYSAELQDGRASVAMTMTTPGCPIVDQMQEMAEAAIWRQVPGVDSVDLQVVWSPPWRPTMMSEEAREQLGWTA